MFPEWVRNYLRVMFPSGDVPNWVREAMAEAGIDLTGVAMAEVNGGQMLMEKP